MDSSTDKQSPRAHYRDRHISLQELSSTVHGFRSRVQKTTNEDLQRQAGTTPLMGLLDFSSDGVADVQSAPKLTPPRRNYQNKKARVQPGATGAYIGQPSVDGLSLQIGQPATVRRRSQAAPNMPGYGVTYGPQSPSYSDDTPVSATSPPSFQFQEMSSMGQDNIAFARHFSNGGVHSMGIPAVPGPLFPVNPEYQTDPACTELDVYQTGLMPSDYGSQFSYAYDGSVVYYAPQQGSSDMYSSVMPTSYYSQAQSSNTGYADPTNTYSSGDINYGNNGNQFNFRQSGFGQ